jgi:6,7-dimethyl-8-ribityllumazine synthase
VSGGGAPRLSIEGAATLRVAVIASQWHERLMDALLDGARRGLRDAGVETDPVVVRVPGAFELPVAVANLAQSGHFHALVALGLVLRGQTPHFDYVCQGVTLGITEVSVRTQVPIGFGLLTCDTEEQAFARSGLPGSTEDKGHEAAQAAVATYLAIRNAA